MRQPALRVSLLVCLLAVAACSTSLNSNAGTSPATAGSSTSSSTTTVAGSTTTAAVVVETGATSAPTTAAATTVAPTTKPTVAPTTTVSGPHFVKTPTFKLSATCTPGTTLELTISWDAAGADSVYDAVADPNGPYNQDLPLKGSDTLNYTCGQPQTYYVVAVKGSTKKIVSKTISA